MSDEEVEDDNMVDYEAERLKNIERNKELLSSLGLDKNIGSHFTGPKKTRKKKDKQETPTTERKSSRLASKPKPTYKAGEIFKSIKQQAEQQVQEQRALKRQKKEDADEKDRQWKRLVKRRRNKGASSDEDENPKSKSSASTTPTTRRSSRLAEKENKKNNNFNEEDSSSDDNTLSNTRRTRTPRTKKRLVKSKEKQTITLSDDETDDEVTLVTNDYKKASNQSPVCMFTGFASIDNYAKTISKLGGTVEYDDVSKATHLIAQKAIRTAKFLCGVQLCEHIVNIEWLNASKDAGFFVDEEEFALKDPEVEKAYNFDLRESMEKAKESKIFDGKKFFITEGVPIKRDLEKVIASTGGYVSDYIPEDGEDCYIISCEADKEYCNRELEHIPRKLIHIHEFVVMAVLQQSVDHENHLLPFE